MDLRHLRTFAAVARTGSFTAAADELGYTQSAVSQHVAALEADLGRTLLTRRPVALTDAGELLAAHARHLLLRADVARSELAARPVAPHRVIVAATPLAATTPLLDTLDRVVAVLDVVEAGEALRRVAQGQADVAAVDGVTAPNGPIAAVEPGVLRRYRVAEVPLEVLLPAGHPLAGAPGVDLDALRDAHWLDAPALRCDPSLVPGGPPPATAGRLRYLGHDLTAVVRLVAGGHGLALLPAGAALDHPLVRRLAVRRPDVVHRVELLTLPARSAELAALLALDRDPADPEVIPPSPR